MKTTTLAALTVAALAATQAAHATIIGAPIDLSAQVKESLLPGGSITDNTQSLTGVGTTPVQSAENFANASKGQNLSGHSTQITSGFASSLASSDGNGGVGVTTWIGGSPSNSDPTAIDQLVAQATWTQSFTYNGTDPASISLRLHIPELQVGLIGVAPQRTGISSTETALAEATLQATITHADGTTSQAPSFEYGLRTFERQLVSGTQFFNFADVQFLGVNDSTVSLFQSFTDNGSDSNPRFSLDAVFANLTLGTLLPGDTVSYVYQLLAEGTTHGFEHGFMAFLGDPFGLNAISDNLALVLDTEASQPPTAGVPEPATWTLALLGIGWVVRPRRRRNRASSQ